MNYLLSLNIMIKWLIYNESKSVNYMVTNKPQNNVKTTLNNDFKQIDSAAINLQIKNFEVMLINMSTVSLHTHWLACANRS